MKKSEIQTRPILSWPEDKDGYFAVPTKQLTPDEEVKARQIRMFAVVGAEYADPTCGNGFTFEPQQGQRGSAYLCGGRADGLSNTCNKFVILTNECLIRKTKTVASPHTSSCGFWEQARAGDPEGQRCPSGRYDDDRINFGTTPNPLGFSCQRCEYGEGMMPVPDSEGRPRWCKLHGFPVTDDACCADNEPDEDSDSPSKAPAFWDSFGATLGKRDIAS